MISSYSFENFPPQNGKPGLLCLGKQDVYSTTREMLFKTAFIQTFRLKDGTKLRKVVGTSKAKKGEKFFNKS